MPRSRKVKSHCLRTACLPCTTFLPRAPKRAGAKCRPLSFSGFLLLPPIPPYPCHFRRATPCHFIPLLLLTPRSFLPGTFPSFPQIFSHTPRLPLLGSQPFPHTIFPGKSNIYRDTRPLRQPLPSSPFSILAPANHIPQQTSPLPAVVPTKSLFYNKSLAGASRSVQRLLATTTKFHWTWPRQPLQRKDIFQTGHVRSKTLL